MAHILITSLPAWGHVNPTLPVARELVVRGHRVTFALPSSFRAVCSGVGAQFVPLDPPAAERRPSGAATDVLGLAALLLDATTDLLPMVLAQLEADRADLVMHDSMAPWGRIAAERLGLPRVCSSTTLAMHPEVFRATSGLSDQLAILTGVPALPRIITRRAWLRARYGATGLSATNLLSNGGTRTLVYTAREFQPRAELFGPDLCFVGPAVRPSREDPGPWLPPGDGALVFASLGTVATGQVDFFRSCVEAAHDRGWRLVMSVGSPELLTQLGALPPGVRAFATVPQVEVLQRTDAFVTHAGMNGVHEAIMARVPMVAAPQQMEQRVVARRVSELGLGRELTRGFTASDLAAGIAEVLVDTGIRTRLDDMARLMESAGGVPRAADEIEAVLGQPCAVPTVRPRRRRRP